MSNKRDSNRLGLVIDVKLTSEDKTEHILKSRNISDTGVFLDYDNEPLKIPIGSHVILQVCSLLDDEAPAPVNAEITRLTDEGIGLKFIL